MTALASKCKVDIDNKTLTFDSRYGGVSIIEKMDGTFLNFGYDTEFFMETRSSRRVTIKNVDKVWGRFSDLGAAFHSLHQETSLQYTLHKIADTKGYVSFDAELFPSLTHVGSDGVARFNVVPYSLSRVGPVGSLVLFQAHVMSSEFKWVIDPLLIDDVMPHINRNAKWHYFSNERHAVSAHTFTLQLGDFIHDITDPIAIVAANDFITSRTKQRQVVEFRKRLEDCRVYMQQCLDELANGWRSFLQDDHVVSPYVEGVILRFVAEGELYEAKGTSVRFGADKEKLWHVREALNSINTMSKACDEHVIIDLVRNSVNPANTFLDFPCTSNLHRNALNALGHKAMNVLDEQSDVDIDTARKNGQALQRVLCTINILSRDGETSVNPYRQMASKFYSTPEYPYSQADGTRVLVWVGRAQPWHRGHTEMIRTGLQACDNFDFDKLVIIPVRGKQSQMTVDNPLDSQQQHACMHAAINALHDHRVIIINPVESASPHEVLITLKRNKMVLCGWLAGEDRCDKYADALFLMDKHALGARLGGVPCALDAYGRLDVKFILTERVLSGTAVRNAALSMPYDEWQAYTTGSMSCDSELADAYSSAYSAIHARSLGIN